MHDENGVFGESVAARYDESESQMFEPRVIDATAGFLAGLAGDGRALELAVGTGRIALSSNYFEIVDGRAEFTTYPFRYVWPSELDLMAQLAGLRLRDRWEDFTRAPFTSESRQHVSVWEKR